MTDVENILNDDDFFGDIVDTPKEGIEQHKKRECLKSLIDRGNAHLLGSKWTQERVDKASDEIVNKTYAEYKQRKIPEKGEKTAKVLGKHVINLYSTGFSRFVKIRDVKNYDKTLRMIKDQMVNLGCFLVYTLGDYLALVLVGVHTLNNLDRGNRQDHENEDYESEGP